MTQAPITVALAAFTFMLTVIWGPPLMRILRHVKAGKIIRVDGPERHMTKMGTPTMGGVLIVMPVMLVTIMLNAGKLIGFTLLGRSVLLPLGVLISFAVLGAIDDWMGLRGSHIGMRPRTKFLFQIALALVAGFGLKYVLDVPELFIPGIKKEVSVGYLYIPFAIILIAGFSNAVNFTDGLDGLAGLICATAFACYGTIALLQDQIFLSRFCFTLVGALFGFLWFNVHPAELFMGDTGSLPLGATLAVVALMTAQWAILPVIAIVPLSILLSVIIQTVYFKITRWRIGEGKRLFKMAPLQHHFELLGWSETQVVQRFWLVSLLAAMIGVGLIFV